MFIDTLKYKVRETVTEEDIDKTQKLIAKSGNRNRQISRKMTEKACLMAQTAKKLKLTMNEITFHDMQDHACRKKLVLSYSVCLLYFMFVLF